MLFLLSYFLQVAAVHINTTLPTVRATINTDRVYTCGVVGVGSKTKWSCGGGDLWILNVPLKGVSQVTSLEHYSGIKGWKYGLLRWQFPNRWYSCVNYGQSEFERVVRVGTLHTMPMAAIESINKNKENIDFGNRFEKYQEQISSGYGPRLRTVGMMTTKEDDDIKLRVFYDFWCRGDNQLEVYVAAPHKGNQLIRSDHHPDRKAPRDQDPILEWDVVGEWTFDWTGPFYVTATGDERFFVTDKGRVYTPPKDAKPGALLKELWKGAPVDVLIHDSDHKKWYAFTKDQYFEVADPIQPKPHALTIRRSWFAEPALETAAKCGRVIRGLLEPK